jgi:CxxC motif-containing protein
VDYAVAEMTAPVRTVTAVVRTASARMPYAPARTDKPIDRELVFPLLAAIYASEAGASFKRGDTLIENFKGSGVNVILCRDEDR